MIAPLILLGGPLVVRAAACTAGVVASLSLTAACAPSDKFLSWGGPLALGLGGIFVASIGEEPLSTSEHEQIKTLSVMILNFHV